MTYKENYIYFLNCTVVFKSLSQKLKVEGNASVFWRWDVHMGRANIVAGDTLLIYLPLTASWVTSTKEGHTRTVNLYNGVEAVDSFICFGEPPGSR